MSLNYSFAQVSRPVPIPTHACTLHTHPQSPPYLCTPQLHSHPFLTLCYNKRTEHCWDIGRDQMTEDDSPLPINWTEAWWLAVADDTDNSHIKLPLITLKQRTYEPPASTATTSAHKQTTASLHLKHIQCVQEKLQPTCFIIKESKFSLFKQNL